MKLSRNQRKHAERRARREVERADQARIQAERDAVEALRAAERAAEATRQRAKDDEDRWAWSWYARHANGEHYCRHPNAHRLARAGKHSHAGRQAPSAPPKTRRTNWFSRMRLMALLPILAVHALVEDEP